MGVISQPTHTINKQSAKSILIYVLGSAIAYLLISASSCLCLAILLDTTSGGNIVGALLVFVLTLFMCVMLAPVLIPLFTLGGLPISWLIFKVAKFYDVSSAPTFAIATTAGWVCAFMAFNAVASTPLVHDDNWYWCIVACTIVIGMIVSQKMHEKMQAAAISD